MAHLSYRCYFVSLFWSDHLVTSNSTLPQSNQRKKIVTHRQTCTEWNRYVLNTNVISRQIFQVESDLNVSMVIDNSYHPSSISLLNLDTVFNPQVMTFYLNLNVDGTKVEINTNHRSFRCSWSNSTTDTQCGQVSFHSLFHCTHLLPTNRLNLNRDQLWYLNLRSVILLTIALSWILWKSFKSSWTHL